MRYNNVCLKSKLKDFLCYDYNADLHGIGNHSSIFDHYVIRFIVLTFVTLKVFLGYIEASISLFPLPQCDVICEYILTFPNGEAV